MLITSVTVIKNVECNENKNFNVHHLIATICCHKYTIFNSFWIQTYLQPKKNI